MMQLPADAKVRVVHLRVPMPPSDPSVWVVPPPAVLLTAHRIRELGYTFSAKGGMTLVRIEFANGDVAQAVARCSPRDNYNKATGRTIAFGRALKYAEAGLSIPYAEHLGVTE